MNSRWPEYDYYYHLNRIAAEVARHWQAAQAKQGRPPLKILPGNLRSWLVRTLGRLLEGTQL